MTCGRQCLLLAAAVRLAESAGISRTGRVTFMLRRYGDETVDGQMIYIVVPMMIPASEGLLEAESLSSTDVGELKETGKGWRCIPYIHHVRGSSTYDTVRCLS